MTKNIEPLVHSVKLNLLSLDNPKMQKLAIELGYIAAGLPLAPHTFASKKTLCPNAEKADCYTHCLFFTGQGGMSENVRISRTRKTRLFTENRKLFMSLLVADLMVLKAIADATEKKLAIRLNMFSDINWLGVYHDGKTVFELFQDVTFYDYTKVPRNPDKLPQNYKLTFSYSPQPAYQSQVQKALKYSMNIAVVFAVKKAQVLPPFWNGIPVIDGDKHDLRFLDPDGVVVGLREKKVTNQEKAADKRKGLVVSAQ